MPMYNLIENSDSYSKTWGHLWQYYRGEPALGNAGAITNFPYDNNNSNNNAVLFKSKQN